MNSFALLILRNLHISYVWKFTELANSFGEIVFQERELLRRIYGLINFVATSAILQSWVAAIFFVIACKKPKITHKFNELIGLDENFS